MIGLKGLKISGSDGEYPGVAIRRFGEELLVQVLLPDDWAQRAQIFGV